MDCVLDETLHCKNCGREVRAGRRQMCKARCKSTCPDCGALLEKKQRLPEGKWWWRCPVCHADKYECVSCNKKGP